MMVRLLCHLYDIMLAMVMACFMVLGYCLYVFLFPFYRWPFFFRLLYSLALAGLAALLACGVFITHELKKRAIQKPYSESFVTVKKGMGLNQIVAKLDKQDIIQSPLQFKLVAVLKGAPSKLKAGRYKLNNHLSIEDILDAMVRGSVYRNHLVVPEGYMAWQIASMLKRTMEIDSAAFMALVCDSAFARSCGVPAGSLEGCLFPDTYLFDWDASAEQIIKIMLRRFEEKFREQYTETPITRKYSRHRIVTMASIVEAEAAVDGERELIAGVFYNRLARRIPLGADPTVRFAVKKYTEPLTVRDLAMVSPYNTRIYRGLPPGPICNPGARALYAAMHPLETTMLYFVAKRDGSNEHFFSETNDGHVQNKERAKQNKRLQKNRGVQGPY